MTGEEKTPVPDADSPIAQLFYQSSFRSRRYALRLHFFETERRPGKTG
jgi:DNA helicase IV